MLWLAARTRKSYNRIRLLANARRAGARGNQIKAIALYERVRKAEPENTDLLRRLAGQRARAGQREEAWRDCRAAAGRLVERGSNRGSPLKEEPCLHSFGSDIWRSHRH